MIEPEDLRIGDIVQVNNQSYSLVLEHLERLSKENEEMEKIRKK